MPQISYVARSFVVDRLLDDSTGFNYWVRQVAPDYDLQPFALAHGTNLFLGAVTVADIIQYGDCTFPLCVVYSARALNPSLVTPSEFSGPVTTAIEWYTSFPDAGPPPDPETPADMIQDALYETFNNAQYYGISSDPKLTYNNELDMVKRSALTPGGLNWIQCSTYTITHRYLTAGR